MSVTVLFENPTGAGKQGFQTRQLRSFHPPALLIDLHENITKKYTETPIKFCFKRSTKMH